MTKFIKVQDFDDESPQIINAGQIVNVLPYVNSVKTTKVVKARGLLGKVVDKEVFEETEIVGSEIMFADGDSLIVRNTVDHIFLMLEGAQS